MTKITRRPAAHESSDYFKRYSNLVESTDVIDLLEKNGKQTVELLNSLTDEQWNYRYQPGKWSIKEVMIHIIDTERIFTYRALRIARNLPQ